MSLNIKGNILSSNDITSVGVFKTEVNRDGLVVYYDAGSLDSYSGTSVIWSDLTGNNNHGTLQNSPTYSSSGYFTLNGSNMNFTNSTYHVSGERSFFLWLYYNSITSLSSGYSLNGIQEVNAYNYIGIINGGQGYYYSGSGSGGGLYNAYFSLSTWYNIGFTMNADGVTQLYTNGVIVDTKYNGVGTTSTAVFQIGSINNAYYLNGRIAMALQYSRALSPYEVAENFQANRGRFGI